MPDAVKRAIRSFVQGFIGVFALAAVPVLNEIVTSAVSGDGSHITVDLNLWRNILLAGFAGGAVMLVAYVQNAIEDKSGKALLK